jgi:hypothetical protein
MCKHQQYHHTATIILSLIIFVFISCSFKTDGGELKQPKEADVSLQNLCIDQFTNENSLLLRRYLSGNPRWEVLEENGKSFAIRKEKENGKYVTALNGFYSNFDDSTGAYQTRVIISFGQYYGFGSDESSITFTDTKDKILPMIIESEHAGSPGSSSYLVIKGNVINVEIFEESKTENRDFTQKTIKEINGELLEVLKHQEEISETGIISGSLYYPFKLDSSFFNVLDGMQPGIYIVQAGLNIDKDGIIYTKVFDSKTNKRLSEDRITTSTIRKIGWDKKRKTIFQYESQLSVYEGDWDHEYEARFEIWFKDKNGNERKLTEKNRMINGWER